MRTRKQQKDRVEEIRMGSMLRLLPISDSHPNLLIFPIDEPTVVTNEPII